jgi:hypothetical protein
MQNALGSTTGKKREHFAKARTSMDFSSWGRLVIISGKRLGFFDHHPHQWSRLPHACDSLGIDRNSARQEFCLVIEIEKVELSKVARILK